MLCLTAHGPLRDSFFLTTKRHIRAVDPILPHPYCLPFAATCCGLCRWVDREPFFTHDVTPGYSLVRIRAARERSIDIFSRVYTPHKKVRYLAQEVRYLSLLCTELVLKLASV